jgi:phosphotransferase system enzyme I (PtsI)
MAVQQQINKFIQGIGASPGIVIGKAYLLERFKVRLPQKRIGRERVEEEVKRFLRAIQESEDQLTEIKEKILDPEVHKHSFILDVHSMILKDEMLLQDTVDTIRKKNVNAEWALDLTLEKLDTAFKAIEDEYLRERRSDLHYVAARIFRNLLGKKHDDITKIKGKVIVVAHDLSPADTLQMNLEHVAGFITDIGGKVSHTAILSRSLGIPAVVGVEMATSLINGGDPLIINGSLSMPLWRQRPAMDFVSISRPILKWWKRSLPPRCMALKGSGFIALRSSISIGKTSPRKKSISKLTEVCWRVLPLPQRRFAR